MYQFLLQLLVVSALGIFTKCDDVPDIGGFPESTELMEIVNDVQKAEKDTTYDIISNDEAVDQDLQESSFNKRSKRGAPKFLLNCQSQFVQCKEKAGKMADLKLKCFPQFSKCFEENRPPLKPQTVCEINLHRCLRNSRDDKTLRLYCYSGFCSCHLNNCPGHPSSCSTKQYKCLKKAGWDLAVREICMSNYRKCVGDK